MRLAGRVALVTGGAVRLGRALVRALAAEEMRVIVHFHRSAGQGAELLRELRSAGREAIGIQADLTVRTEVRRLATEAEAVWGGVDVLVNSASVFAEASLDQTDDEEWDRAMAVDLAAPFFLTQQIGRGMRARGRGVIVNLTDLAGMQAWRGYTAHAIAKAGLIHLTRVAARSLAPEVRVVAISPGTVLPPADLTPEQIEQLALNAPLRRNGSPDDVVQAMLYLLRADFVTGVVHPVDGGRALGG